MEEVSKELPAESSNHFAQETHESSSPTLHSHDAFPQCEETQHQHIMIDGSVGEMVTESHHEPIGVVDVAMGAVVDEDPMPNSVANAVEGEASSTLHHHHEHAFANEALAEHPDQGPAMKRQRLDEAGAAAVPASAAAAAAVAATNSEIAAQNKKVHNEQWNEMLERLKAYKARYGNCLVPKRFSDDGKLGTWVETQRVQYKRLPRAFDEAQGCELPQPNKRLTGERLQKLNDLGFCWSAKHIRKTGSTGSLSSASNTPNAAKMALNSSTANATMRVTENDGAVPASEEVPDSVSFVPTSSSPGTTTDGATAAVAETAMPQQQALTVQPAAVSTALATTVVPAPEPRAASDSSFPNFAYRANGRNAAPVNVDAQWEEFYNRLIKFKEWYGHVLVPRKYETDPKLGAWVESQRVLWNRDYNPNKEKVPAGTAAPAAAAWSIDPAAPSLPAAAAVAPLPNAIKKLTQERKQKLDDIGFVWSLRSKRIEDHWDEMFKQLVEYKNQHGDCLVPSRFEANLKLGKWVETQRYEWTKLQRATTSDTDEPPVPPPVNPGGGARPANPRLTPERLRRLESIGFEWKVKNKMKRYYDKQWDGMFQRLLDFKAIHGHCNVPKRFPDNLKLGTWVHTQRIQYRKLVSGNTKGLGKDGSPTSGKSSPTNAAAVAAADNPDFQYTEENASEIAAWSVEQAQSYRLTDERRKRLEEVGFCWSAREGNEKTTLETSGRITRNSYDDQWDAMFDLLVNYKAERGDCLVPKRFQPNPKLGTWVDTQRVQYKKMLKKIADLQHKKQEGETVDDNASVGSTGKESSSGTPLVGRLTQERIQRLQNLGFVWSLRDDWAKHYEELKVYKQMNSHCNVPARYTENRRLGIWVSAQRQQYKILQQQKHLLATQQPPMAPFEGEEAAGDAPAGGNANSKARRSAPLTQERIDLLHSLGFVWTIRSRDSLGESWNQRLIELREFKHRYGHCLVPSRYDANPELGIWVGTQRTQYRLFMRSKETGVPVSTSMNEDRIRELEDLGFVWALRGAMPDETVAAADAAATAVEIADQVAVGVVGVGHPPPVVYHHAHPHHHAMEPHQHQHQQHHPYGVHHVANPAEVTTASATENNPPNEIFAAI